ncbi:hypothetical protein GCM10025868_24870 [Angustibacter aerolatus]|uniref:Uncharacterized protein n=1 Tax=Angustibacter aerolatus TaxID=1162965 RepID=A0ABQ6JG98_9ACTN|nr:hypothetical protein GCM10025868_24870 [Angustibacter aerolatus]
MLAYQARADVPLDAAHDQQPVDAVGVPPVGVGAGHVHDDVPEPAVRARPVQQGQRGGEQPVGTERDEVTRVGSLQERERLLGRRREGGRRVHRALLMTGVRSG